MNPNDTLAPCTLIQHFGESAPPEGAPSFPLFQNSNFLYSSHGEFVEAISNLSGHSPYIYSRIGNPTVDLLEQKIARLEGAEACRATAAGIAALTSYFPALGPYRVLLCLVGLGLLMVANLRGLRSSASVSSRMARAVSLAARATAPRM